MELTPVTIPDQFKTTIPQGMRLLRKGDFEVLAVESLFCPNGHNLLVDSVRIHREPSIKLAIRVGSQEGFVFLDSIWGSHANLFTFMGHGLDESAVVSASCPYCGVSLMHPHTCSDESCGVSEQIEMYLPGRKNRIQVCPSVSCSAHHLQIDEIPRAVLEELSDINYFGAGQEDIFGGI